jgi:D-sedoheptulose 7-phosphate isomerase
MTDSVFLKSFSESVKVKTLCIEQGFDILTQMGGQIISSVEDGGKIIFCGNGGSAADAQHLAAEMLIRLRPSHSRKPIPAMALAQDISTITACGNDFSFEGLYERLICALGNANDVLIVISTSGNSENIILAMKAAKDLGVKVFGFLGSGGGKALEFCDEAFVVPSDNTARIQEAHITAGHALMEFIEDKLIESNFIQLDD